MSERILEGLEPSRVFHYFEEISSIPRPSYKEKEISDYLVSFAKERGLEHYQDDLFNVVIIKEASEGREGDEPIIIQGHMDMVCEKEADCEKDMDTEGLDLFIDGDFVKAKGTTLGADDGAAVAIALALLEDDEISHPRLEFVCTVSEETGMEGAHRVDLSMLKGHNLLNLDSEGEGEVLASCAGGGRLGISYRVSRDTVAEGTGIRVVIGGLVGGHSGTEINKGRANANLLMARCLRRVLQHHKIKLVEFEGGTKDNAICRQSNCLMTAEVDEVEDIKRLLLDEIDRIKVVYSAADPDISIDITEENLVKGEITCEETQLIVRMLLSLPNGVIRMSDHIEGLVETSLNLGILKLNDESFDTAYSLRSSVGAAYDALRENMRFMAEGYGADVKEMSEYSAWEYVEVSPFRDRLKEIYMDKFGKELRVEAIHAGVECGILADKIEGLDAVSMGPDIFDIHTPEERMSISSMQRTYDFVRRIIEG